MSYNYDANPWDDNYDPNQQQQATTQNAASYDYGGYTAGYSNPMAQDTGQSYQYEYVPQDQQQQYDYSSSQQQQEPNQDQTNASGAQKPNESKTSCFEFIRILCPCLVLIPGRSALANINLPFIDALFQHVNKDLLVSKVFYFFFYSAFGSLFPLMGVYFKQLGMNPAQVGILNGVRPFIEMFSSPFWNNLADKFQRSKALLLFSIASWIIFTYSLANIRPPASACIAFNDTDYMLYTPYSENDLSNVVPSSESFDNSNNINETLAKMDGSPENESKSEILASEENENDQGRRRRKRAANPRDRYAYKIQAEVDGNDEQRSSANLDLDIDLESDFDDSSIESSRATGSESRVRGSYYDRERDGPSEYEDFEQMYSKGSRSRRSTEMRNSDEGLGDSEESDSEPEEDDRSKQKAKYRDESEEEAEAEAENQNRKMKQNVMVATTPEPTTTTRSSSEFSGLDSEEIRPANRSKKVYRQRHKTPPTHIVGMSPITVEYAANYNKEKHNKFVTPMFSTIVYKVDDVKNVFFLLLLLISLGEFFSAPALTLADTATLGYLGANTDHYARQRMFGSLSWAIALLLVGMALDNATSIADHPCGPHIRERSYTIGFVTFSLLMGCAFLTATQFRFTYNGQQAAGTGEGSDGTSQTLVTSTTGDNKVVTTTIDSSQTGNVDELYASTQPRSIFNTAPPVNAPSSKDSKQDKLEFLDKWKSAVFAQRAWEIPGWANVFRQFGNALYLTYLFITWFLGCGVGLVFTFLFWHLQDVGGTPTLFGICSIINHVSEILAYFFSYTIIKRYGHTRVLSVGLGINVIRFIYVAFLTNPYYALPFELVQGITHVACFAACCSTISRASKPELRTSTLGVMQSLHHGIGRACGAIIGGYMINAIGSRATFCIYGLLSGCVLGGFLHVRKKAIQLEEVETKVDDSEALGGYAAPQGVPSVVPGKMTQSVPTTAAQQQDIDYQW